MGVSLSHTLIWELLLQGYTYASFAESSPHVAGRWDALQSELAAEVGRWEDLPRFWCPSQRKSW